MSGRLRCSSATPYEFSAKDGCAAFRECDESDSVVFFRYLDVNHEVSPLATYLLDLRSSTSTSSGF